MILVYTDDSGISWEKNDGFWIDGPYIIHCGVMVNQDKYFHLERLFFDLSSSLLKIKSWKTSELHATDIWHRKGAFAHLSETDVKKYFSEFLQLLSKLSIKVVIGVQVKNKKISSKKTKEEMNLRSQYAFLHGVEYTLSLDSETGLIICDEGDKMTSLSQLLYKRSQWRYDPGADKRKIKHMSKFKYETLSCFIIDQLHTVSSKESFFIQIADHVAFITQRVFTYSYLKVYPSSTKPDDSKVPVTTTDYRFFAQKSLVASYNLRLKDVVFSYMDEVILHRPIEEGDYLPRNFIESITLENDTYSFDI